MRTKPTMSKRMLRSVTVVALSAVVAFGVSGFSSGAKGEERVGGDIRSSSTVLAADSGDKAVAFPNDSVWS